MAHRHDEGTPSVSGPAATPTARARRHRRFRRIITVLALLLVVEYLVVPQLAGARNALELLSDVRVEFLVVGVALELAALGAYAQLLHSLLPHDERPARRTLLRIQMATKAVSNVVPGGSAAGTGLGFDLLRKAGVRPATAAFVLGTQGIGSAVVLNALLWAALVVSIPLRGFNPLYATAAFLGAALIAFVAAAVLLLSRGEERAADLLCRLADRLPLVNPEVVGHTVRVVAQRLRALAGHRRLLVQAVGWAAANWLLDAAALWVFLRAFGQRLPVDGLLVAFGLANVVAAIPVTPGGLGVIEATITPLLVGFGASRGPAILGVVSWRMLNYWLPIPAGAVAYLSLRLRPGEVPTSKTEALEELTDREPQAIESLASD